MGVGCAGSTTVSRARIERGPGFLMPKASGRSQSASGWHRKRATPADAARRRQYASSEHRALRKQGAALVATGRGYCWRCGSHIPPGSRWHLGHDDDDRTVYRGIECVSCNLGAAASKGAQIVNARGSQRRTSRRW